MATVSKITKIKNPSDFSYGYSLIVEGDFNTFPMGLLAEDDVDAVCAKIRTNLFLDSMAFNGDELQRIAESPEVVVVYESTKH